ncbi:glycoside hydrolase family 5 protein [bacterium]|nr:glycoside hydrolase family 5 protein [bacterium]
MSGLEFSKVIDPFVIPNLSAEDSSTTNSDLTDTQAFIDAGMNTVRVPVSWGYLQLEGPGEGDIYQAYYANYVRPLLQTLTHAKVNTIVDLHAYMRYSKFGQQYSGCGSSGQCPDGQLITDEKAYESVWGKLVDLIQKDNLIDKDYILFDLMNEPVGVPDDKVFTIQACLIKLIRSKQFDGYILVEGNNWSGLHSWTTEEWTGADGRSYTNASLFTRDNFAQAGITDLSKILINVHQYLDSNYSGTHDDCQQDLTTTGANGFNLDAFVDYMKENQLQAIVTEFGSGRNSTSCSAPLHQFMQYLKDNKTTTTYGFAGWTIWSTGHGWGNYNLRVVPQGYQMQILNYFL